jgi:hypothetical protein
MRRRGKSPWLEAEKNRVVTANPQGVAHAIAGGATPLYAWRVQRTFTVAKLARLTKLSGQRLMSLEGGATPFPDELEALSAALKVAPELLAPQAGPDAC